MKLTAFFLLFFPVFSFAAYFSPGYSGSNNQMLTSGGSQYWYLTCLSGTTLHSISNLWLDSVSGTLANVDIKLDGSTVFSTTSVPSSGAGRAYTVPMGDFVCDGTTKTLEIDATNAATFQTRQMFFNAGEEAFNTPVDVTSSTTLSGMTRISGLYYYTPPSSSSSSTTTYVPVNQYVTSLECVNSTPTTTCAFAYSTSTATSTYDYRPYFDYITLFVGLLLFGVGVWMFRSVAVKYL